jgi:hypothetical protein
VKPVPLAVNPDVGSVLGPDEESEKLASTVKVWSVFDASTDAECPCVSDAVTVCEPATAAGTVNVHGEIIVPKEFVLHVPMTPAFAPPSVKLIVSLAANPAPVTVTVSPTYTSEPDAGVIVIEASTVNDVTAKLGNPTGYVLS